MLVVAAAQTGRIQSCKPKPSVAIGTQSNPLCASAGGDGGSGPREHDDLERWCGGRALPWHRADLGFSGAHALSRCARVARMDSCGPLLATHFLLEKQVEARPPLHSITSSARASKVGGTSSSFAVLTLFGRRYIHQVSSGAASPQSNFLLGRATEFLCRTRSIRCPAPRE